MTLNLAADFPCDKFYEKVLASDEGVEINIIRQLLLCCMLLRLLIPYKLKLAKIGERICRKLSIKVTENISQKTRNYVNKLTDAH